MAHFPIRSADQNSILAQFRQTTEPVTATPAVKDSYGSDMVPGLLPNSPFTTDILLHWSSALTSNMQLQEEVFERYPALQLPEMDAVRLPNLPVFVAPGSASMGMVFGSYYNTLRLGDGVDIPGNTFVIHVPAYDSDHAKAPFTASPLVSDLMTSPGVSPTLELIQKVNKGERDDAARKQLQAVNNFFRAALTQTSTSLAPATQSNDPRRPAAPTAGAPSDYPKVLTITTHASVHPSIPLAHGEPHDIYISDEYTINDGNGEPSADRPPSSISSTPMPELATPEAPSHLPPIPFIPPTVFATEANAVPPRLNSHYNLRPTVGRLSLKETPYRPKKKVPSGIVKSRKRRLAARQDLQSDADTVRAMAEDEQIRLNQVLDLPVTSWTDSEATMVKSASNALVRASVDRVGFGEYCT